MSPPRVLVVLVLHDDAAWLSPVLSTLAAQSYDGLELVVVDNATAPEIGQRLTRRVQKGRVVRSEREVGFGHAVALGLEHAAVGDDDLILLWHDDLVLAPDGVEHLVARLVSDPELAIVGPKLRQWTEEPVLSEVGLTIDPVGRIERGMDADELDQGQHDHRSTTLFVSTAGLLMRASVLRELGGLDPRFRLFRDDMDLCWRAWLAGHRVEVVPEALGYHVAAASSGRRSRALGSGHRASSRYLSERHTLAALLKNTSTRRLFWVVPLHLLYSLAKVLALVATRRFAGALAVLRAYSWNLAELRRTRRMRRAVQAGRVRSDAELSPLFARGLPRVREAGAAVSDWLAGGNTRAILDDDQELPSAITGNSLTRAVRRHPVGTGGLVVLVLYLVGVSHLLGPGQLIGGQTLPWPESPRAFLRAYASPWNGEPAGTGAFASPIQAALGLLSFLGFGSAWLAQRLLVLGLPVLAWALAARAGRLITSRPWPRVLGATLYAASPVVLGALAQGRYGVLIWAALLPGLVLVGLRAADQQSTPAAGWRGAAWSALGVVLVVGADPALSPVLLPWVLGLAVLAVRSGPRPWPALLRLLTAALGALLVLIPWLVGLFTQPGAGVFLERVPNDVLPAWRALTVTPAVLTGLDGPIGLVVALGPIAVVVASLLLVPRLRPVAVTGLLTLLVGSALLAWVVSRTGVEPVWVPALLLPGALAVGGLGTAVARDLGRSLSTYAFGIRQLASLSTAVMLSLSVLMTLVVLARGPFDELRRNADLVPLFVGADEPRVGPYRVLLLDTAEGEVRWELTDANGPTMVSFGTVQSQPLLDRLQESIVGLVSSDPEAGNALGLANVRYVVVDESTAPGLLERLPDQPALEPLPSTGGRVFRVRSWLPRAAVLPAGRGRPIVRRGLAGDTERLESMALARARPGAYRGVAPSEGGVLVVSEASSSLWRAVADGRRLQPIEVADGLPLNAFEVPEDTVLVRALAGSGGGHVALVLLQVLVVAALLSLALRPPAQAARSSERTDLPALLRSGQNVRSGDPLGTEESDGSGVAGLDQQPSHADPQVGEVRS